MVSLGRIFAIIILQDPIFATADYAFLGHPLIYPFTQLGTAVSHLWEWTFPVILLAFHFRDTRHRPGRLRHFFNRWDVRLWYVALEVIFHVLLGLTLQLGIFPLAMLALYPAFFHPLEFQALMRRFQALAGWNVFTIQSARIDKTKEKTF